MIVGSALERISHPNVLRPNVFAPKCPRAQMSAPKCRRPDYLAPKFWAYYNDDEELNKKIIYFIK